MIKNEIEIWKSHPGIPGVELWNVLRPPSDIFNSIYYGIGGIKKCGVMFF